VGNHENTTCSRPEYSKGLYEQPQQILDYEPGLMAGSLDWPAPRDEVALTSWVPQRQDAKSAL